MRLATLRNNRVTTLESAPHWLFSYRRYCVLCSCDCVLWELGKSTLIVSDMMVPPPDSSHSRIKTLRNGASRGLKGAVLCRSRQCRAIVIHIRLQPINGCSTCLSRRRWAFMFPSISMFVDNCCARFDKCRKLGLPNLAQQLSTNSRRWAFMFPALVCSLITVVLGLASAIRKQDLPNLAQQLLTNSRGWAFMFPALVR
jgi:hypothetical protein